MKSPKTILAILALALALSGLRLGANCSATATGCSASCSINNVPPGGTSVCTGSRSGAECRGWDAAGILCCVKGCTCPSGMIGGYCYIMIGSTCC